MSDDGYTLTEMLVALATIGLAVGGLSQGAHVIGRVQSSAAGTLANEKALRAAQATLEQLVGDAGPGQGSGEASLTGSATGFKFLCGKAPCGATVSPAGGHISLNTIEAGHSATIVLPTSISQARFVYGSAIGESDRWPAAAAGRQRLEWVELRGGPPNQPVMIADARLWIEQPQDCVFDAVTRTCSAATP